MRCIECGAEIVTTRELGYEVTGFEVERRQGGTNHLLRRKRTGRVLCPSCVTAIKHGISTKQEAML